MVVYGEVPKEILALHKGVHDPRQVWIFIELRATRIDSGFFWISSMWHNGSTSRVLFCALRVLALGEQDFAVKVRVNLFLQAHRPAADERFLQLVGFILKDASPVKPGRLQSL